jgi:hypothetical protein
MNRHQLPGLSSSLYALDSICNQRHVELGVNSGKRDNENEDQAVA